VPSTSRRERKVDLVAGLRVGIVILDRLKLEKGSYPILERAALTRNRRVPQEGKSIRLAIEVALQASAHVFNRFRRFDDHSLICSIRERLRGGLLIAVNVGALGIIALVVAGYLGLGGAESPAAVVVSAILLAIALASAVLYMPVLVLDEDPAIAFGRAVRTIWRPVAGCTLGVAYLALLLGATGFGPDQLQFAGGS